MSNKIIFILSLAGCLFLLKCKSNTSVNNIVFTNDILLQSMTDLEVIQGTRTSVFLAAIDDHLEQVKFSCLECEPFIFLSENKNGKAILTIDAPKDILGIETILIKVINDENSTITKLNITFTKHKGDIYYCNPQQKEGNEIGTFDQPFSSLTAIMKSDFVPSDGALFLLLNGLHGVPVITKNNITIAAAAGHNPQLSGIHLQETEKVVLSGLNFGSHYANDFEYRKYLINIDSTCSDILIQNCLIESSDQTANWTTTDWNTKAGNGIMCQAKNTILQNNLVRNIFHGIQTENSNIQVKYNTVDRFSGDAIRNIGSNNSYTFNLLKNAVLDDYYAPEGNHDDLFQSWTFDLPIENIQLKNNIAISCLEPDLPLKSKVVQGLVCFDGFEKNWAVENNLVVTDHPHGIALYGAEDCKISNNVVLRNPLRLFQYESDPWIMINNHKDGRESKNCEVVNNITSALNIVSADVIKNNNTIVDSISVDIFMDYAGWDFRKK